MLFSELCSDLYVPKRVIKFVFDSDRAIDPCCSKDFITLAADGGARPPKLRSAKMDTQKLRSAKLSKSLAKDYIRHAHPSRSMPSARRSPATTSPGGR